MNSPRIEALLDQLSSDFMGGFDQRSVLLREFSDEVLRRPRLVEDLVERVAVTEDVDDKRASALGAVLSAVLDNARLAEESGLKRGKQVRRKLIKATQMAVVSGRLRRFHRLLLGRVWSTAGLDVPECLGLTAADMMAAGNSDTEISLEEMLQEAIVQSEGDALSIHAGLREACAVMSLEARCRVVAWTISHPDPIHAKLAAFWLLDPSSSVRMEAAEALKARVSRKALSDELASKLVVIRSWMPNDDARSVVDRVIAQAMRAGLTIEARKEPWTVSRIVASLPDGGGAQSIMVALERGGRHRIAMLLLKQLYGVKDAYTVPCRSEAEQKGMMAAIARQTDAHDVSLAWLEQITAMALADSAATSLPPAPGLVEVAELCGFSALRPNQVETAALVGSLPNRARIAAFSAPARGRLINESAGWSRRHRVVTSWFEEGDEAYEILKSEVSDRAARAALGRWLEGRREFWTRLIGRSAAVLAEAGHRDADAFAAVAVALLEDRPLSTIPIMEAVQEQTVEAASRKPHDALSQSDEAEHRPLNDFPALTASTARKDDALASLLADADVGPDWLDGFLVSVILAPDVIEPDQWLCTLLTRLDCRLDDQALEHGVHLVVMRGQEVRAAMSNRDLFEATLHAMSRAAQKEWSAGFLDAATSFAAHWPPSSMTRDYKAVLNQVSTGAQSGLDTRGIKLLSEWVATQDMQECLG